MALLVYSTSFRSTPRLSPPSLPLPLNFLSILHSSILGLLFYIFFFRIFLLSISPLSPPLPPALPPSLPPIIICRNNISGRGISLGHLSRSFIRTDLFGC